MKRSVLLVNILGIFALGYLLYADYMNMFLDPVTTYTDTNNVSGTVLSTATVIGMFAAIALVLTVISDIYWLVTGKSK